MIMREPPTRAFPVNEATEANEHYAALLFALWRTMIEDCDKGCGTSGIREAAELLRPALAELEKERGRMVHDHLRYNDAETHELTTTFRALVRPGMLKAEAERRAERDRILPCDLPAGAASLAIDEV